MVSSEPSLEPNELTASAPDSPEAVAEAWVERIGSSMRKAGIPEVEIQQNAMIWKTFTLQALDQLKKDPTMTLPLINSTVTFGPSEVDKTIEFFLRTVNQMIRKLREQKNLEDADRRWVLEQAAWETFNVVKVIIGIRQIHNADTLFQGLIDRQQDMKSRMTFTLLKQCLSIKDLFGQDAQAVKLVRFITDETLKRYLHQLKARR